MILYFLKNILGGGHKFSEFACSSVYPPNEMNLSVNPSVEFDSFVIKKRLVHLKRDGIDRFNS